MLFTDRSIWTMIHGIALSGAALMALSAALFSLGVGHVALHSGTDKDPQSRALAYLTVFIAVMLWLTVLVGTYVVFPLYRATPPQGVTDLTDYPRALLLASPDTAWLHAFAMEVKEHVPWIASMLATAVAFVTLRYRSGLLTKSRLRNPAATFLAICFVLVALVALLGVFVNKVAPVQ